MEYELIRSKRKTCAIYIRNNSVEVRAPLWLHKTEIDRFVKSKAVWIRSKLAESALQLEKRQCFMLDYGSIILYRGEEYEVVAVQGERTGLSDAGLFMPPGLPPDEIKRICVKIYRLFAKSVLTKKTLDFAEHMGISPTAVKINGAKTRWGSCSAQGNINFSWRLMMASDFVIDYVVVHELAHLKEMNHSPRFWAVVENILPDFNERRKELKILQKRLRLEDWDD